eukprot:Sdes_comp21773_c0_seq1m20346
MTETSNRWYFTKEQLDKTPSRREGIDANAENAYRVDGATIIQDIGMHLKLPQLTIATAIVFFHRFYMYQSFKEFSRWSMGICCLFLAGKVEETPKKLRDILIAGHHMRFLKTQRNSPNQTKYVPLSPDSKEFWDEKETLLYNERILLQTLGFDLSVEHAYQYLLNYVKALKGNKELAQTAWNFLNDCLRTTLCLQHPPQRIATSVILLAAHSHQYELQNAADGRPWWKVFVNDVEFEILEQIGHQILNVYQKDLGETSAKPLSAVKRNASATPTTELEVRKVMKISGRRSRDYSAPNESQASSNSAPSDKPVLEPASFLVSTSEDKVREQKDSKSPNIYSKQVDPEKKLIQSPRKCPKSS